MKTTCKFLLLITVLFLLAACHDKWKLDETATLKLNTDEGATTGAVSNAMLDVPYEIHVKVNAKPVTGRYYTRNENSLAETHTFKVVKNPSGEPNEVVIETDEGNRHTITLDETDDEDQMATMEAEGLVFIYKKIE